MQIILTKEEYDDLIKKATALELQVEVRVEEERKKLAGQLHDKIVGIFERHSPLRGYPNQGPSPVVRELREFFSHHT